MNESENQLGKKWKFDFSVPVDSNVNAEKLKDFLKDGDVLIFYGGEPLVNIEKMIEIMNSLEGKNVKFCMQTNGKLLDEIPEKYLKRFSRILVSIDGNKERTDFNRGEGDYDLILKNIREIIKKDFNGELVARMTISQEFPDIYEQVKHLIEIKEFDSVHWQLDLGFYKDDFEKNKIEKFVKEYNKSLSKLVDFWLKEMRKGKVLKLYPFLGIFESLYYNKKTKLRCGSGYAGYTINTQGNITACPIMNEITDFYCGNLNSKEKLKEIYVGEPCVSCDYIDLCGGRCLYSNKAKLWPEKGEKLICKTIIHLIEEIKRVLPEIKELIKKGTINEEDFSYEKYFGPEIIP
jgi:putative peptide-modifying radical SAM enzyme